MEGREMAEKIDPEAAARITGYVEELAALDYPKVWVGEYGITAAELLTLQDLNEGLPEYMRVEPVEAFEVEESGAGLTMPGISADWIDGRWALFNLPFSLMAGGVVFAELEEHVMTLSAAKDGQVRVCRSCRLAFEPMGEISPIDRGIVSRVARAVTEDGYVLVPGVPEYAYVPIEDLVPEDVDEELLEDLGFWASGEQVVAPGYVIEDTPWARAAVEARLRG